MTGNWSQSVGKLELTIYTLGNLVSITAQAALVVYIQHKGLWEDNPLML